MALLTASYPFMGGLPGVLRQIRRQGNIHTFGNSGLDHLGPLLDDFRAWGWIPPQYDNDGGRPTWLYRESVDTPLPPAGPGADLDRRRIAAACYPGNAFDNYDVRENKCFQAAVLPSGEALIALCLYLWRTYNRIDEAIGRPSMFPGEGIMDLPVFFRRLLVLFSFGSASLRPGPRARSESLLQGLVEQVTANRSVEQANLPRGQLTVGQLLRFFKESAGSRTARATAESPAFYTELYAQFAYGHPSPRNRFWRAYVAALLEEAEVLSAPPPPPPPSPN